MKRNLSVMMLSWEFPPRVIGGISPHVYFLSKSLAKNGMKVYVVTCDFPGAPAHETLDGVEVYRVDSYKNPAPDFATWVYLMNLNMQKEAAAIAGSSWTARLTHITVPLARKGLLAAWLLAFLFCLRDTGLALVVYPPGRETLPVALFTLMANGRPALISALCILILLSAAVPFGALALLFAKGRS